MLRSRLLLAACALGAMAALPALPATAQQIPGYELGQTIVSRAALEDLANRLEATAESRNFSSAVRNDARARAAQVRARLQDGDFQVGDRIMLTVDAETALTRMYVVLAGRQISLPGIGMLPMAGVLRVELAEHIRTFLARYLRDPKVRADALIRIVMIGGVGKQGWHTMPVDIPLDSALEIAGGLSGNAEIHKMRIERDGERLFSGRDLERVISDGATLDALNMQQGDQIIVPESRPQTTEQRIRSWQFLIQLPIQIFALARLLGF